MDWIRLGLLVAGVLMTMQGSFGQYGRQPACDQSSCYPATGDLLIGREQNITASSTCGVQRPERFCIVSHLEEEKKCFVCDSRQPYVQGLYNMSHRVENIVSSFLEDRKQRWWQAENGMQKVYIQVNFEAEFHFTHLIMRFKTFRPSAMFVERSNDWGQSWHVYRYFAYDCAKSFPGIPVGPIRNINDVICESRYSDVAPSTYGEVIFRVLPPNIEIEDPYSEQVQDLLKMTNLRINFTELHTLGDDLLDSRDEIKEKYYYALYEMVVRGSCSCYGHASRCRPIQGQIPQTNMVYGECECTHNTEGLNCERCQPFYNDLPWRPALGRETNACKKCNCNQHSERCFFDPAVYEATGRVSGGVCEACQHNTMGRNCERCLPKFYQDPIRRVTDYDFCKPCECDPIGSEHDGECESHTDVDAGLVAGRCLCKRFVTGTRCDSCIDGFWNMRDDNPEGCEECTCNTQGTVGNYGCDKISGECRCKRYVTGRVCDQCLPQYWGLSEDPEGCQPCECDVGGSFDNNCDQQTGQCNCRPNIIGRRCDQPAPGYFVPNLDHYVYEGEESVGTGNTHIVIREPIPGRDTTWTGPGFIRVSEGDSIEFTVDNLPMDMEYDIVIRYEPQMPDRWEDVRVTVVRPDSVDQEGTCANSIPQDDFKATSLPPGSGEVVSDLDPEEEAGFHTYWDEDGHFVQSWRVFDMMSTDSLQGERHYIVSPSSCLEKDVSYTIRIDFNRYKSDRTTPEASVLIDSITLVPHLENFPIFQGGGVPERMREEFERYNCREQQLSVLKYDMHEICSNYIFSITAIMEEEGLDCQCDPTGSLSAVCEGQGGRCECKPNVIGRRCDQCAPGTYGFGPAGCIACECSAIGARDNFCDPVTGQCLCLPGVYGRQCNQCQRGYWNFPNCRPCQCNGRADECNNEDGTCYSCRDNTGGVSCDRCADGYYGDAAPGSPVGCRACMCPGGAGSGYQHGDTCELDIYTNQVICNCQAGYTGIRCDRCEENFFGNPLEEGGQCQRCTCNNNIDPDVPGSCDATTGECLRCMFHTEGFNCERCTAGYYGDATQQNCMECICNILGTDRSAGPCDSVTGQCPCLPNVIGPNCDRCAPNHWKIASGLGCESCDCDPEGSVMDQCNEYDGQCECRPGRGGRTCSECEANHWGDPNVQCYPCECDRDGSETMQCDRRTGACVCVEGVAGHNCDRCDRGTTGDLPYCVPCGECFDNWDRIITALRNETDELVNEGSSIKIEGAPGAFRREFQEMERKLDEVRRILAGANVTSADLDGLRDRLAVIRENLTESLGEVDEVDMDLQDTTNRIEAANNRLESIKRRIDQLKRAAEDLRNNATSIKELDVAGAYNSTRQSQQRSQAAQQKVDDTERIVRESQNVRTNTEELIDTNQERFDRQYTNNEQNVRDIDSQLNRLDAKITDLNEMVCDGRGDPCDLRCGGAGCGKCGGASCDQGAVTKAANALDFARRADEILRDKSQQAADLLNDVRAAEITANAAKNDAQMAYDVAMEAKNESETNRAELEDLLNRITQFLGQAGASPTEIRTIAEEALGMSISLTPEQVQERAREIEETIAGLTDIDSILEATRDDLAKARQLKNRADRAKDAADEILGTAERVIEALDAAEEAQNKANDAIDQAEFDITNAEEDLAMIETEAQEALQMANETLQTIRQLEEEATAVKTKFIENENKVINAEQEADRAERKAEQAEQDANDLEDRYNQVADQLGAKYNQTREAKERADRLRDRASEIYLATYDKLNRLRGMEEEFGQNEKLLTSLTTEIAELNRQMQLYLTDIIEVSRTHRTCST